VSTRILSDSTQIPYLDDGTVDMGSSFDLFHPVSHHDTPLLTDPIFLKNRELLRQTMMHHGFKDYENEWWHYTLANEPYPSTYFDFVTLCQSLSSELR
jgi:D-alanyl-D-alanine dipeptidase